MTEDMIRELAHRKWEEEGRPDGAHERHWREAENQHRKATGTPQTMPSDHNSGVCPPTASEPDDKPTAVSPKDRPEPGTHTTSDE